ncbi:MAG TPA: hypothetical protein VN926_23830 [Bradyrhizobium sp.]|jgi:hypothetical protein|nr:hypothetical protein [Bradyrhizobium sp.]
MANERNPNDLYRPNPADDPYRTNRDDELRRAARPDDEVLMDPELAEGPARGGRIAMFAIAIAVVLGAVFYGLNNSSVNHSGPSTAQNTTQSSPPAAPPGMRDVTPRANTDSGVTTGAAPARPAPPPAANNAPANSAPSK